MRTEKRLVAKCLHITIEPVAIIGTRELTNGQHNRYVASQAMQCQQCHTAWRYVDPDDLPHWLYIRLRREKRLPMPDLTPEIMKALSSSAEASHE